MSHPESDFGPKTYKDGRTKQSFKNSTDINKILNKAQKAGTLSHLVKHGAHYGDFSDMPDLLEAHRRLAAGQAIFDELPSEIRDEFQNNAAAFFTYVNDPNNSDRLTELLPGLAEPGRQRRILNEAPSEPVANVQPEGGGSPTPDDSGDTGASAPS